MKTDTKNILHSKIIDKTPFFYGWVILIAGTLGIIMSSPGQTYSFSIFLEEFIRELKLSRSLVSSLYTIGTISGSLALPFIGRLIDKYGSRRMVLLITLALGLACIYMSVTFNAVSLLLGFVLMRMLGQSSIVMVSRNVINQWWVKRRGFVLGITTLLAAVLGVGLFPTLINWLIPQFGWRFSYLILGALVMGVMLPVGYIFFRDNPELYGLLPDGSKANEMMMPGHEEVSSFSIEEHWTAREAMGTPAFWLIVFSIGAFSMLGTGLTFHIVSIFADNGLSADMAAAVFLPMSLTTSLLGIPGGWLIDRFDAKYMLFAGLILLAIVILFSAFIATPQLAILYGILFGLANGVARVVGNVIYANYFGRQNLGSILGVTSTFGAAASGLGPLVYGVGRDLAGDYWPSLWMSALYPALMAVLILFMRRPRKQ